MKTTKKLIQLPVALFALTFAFASFAAPAKSTIKPMVVAPDQNEVVVSVNDAYIPSGFDSGSDAFVVVNGLFPNTCYQWKEAVVNNVTDTQHEIRSMAKVHQGLCMMMLVPFTREIQIGKLQKGNHTLRFMNGDGTYLEKQMVVE